MTPRVIPYLVMRSLADVSRFMDAAISFCYCIAVAPKYVARRASTCENTARDARQRSVAQSAVAGSKRQAATSGRSIRVPPSFVVGEIRSYVREISCERTFV
jgi:hypothetical protein